MTISQYMRVHRHSPAVANWDIISISPDFMRMQKSERKSNIEKSVYQELTDKKAIYTLRLDFVSRRLFNEIVDQSIILKNAKIAPANEYSYDSDIRLVLYVSNKDFIKTAVAFKHNQTSKEKRLK